MSKIISVEKIAPGMELASDVRNKFGQILLGASSKLEEKHKKIFKTWGILSVDITDSEAESAYKDIDEPKLAEVRARISKRFLWTPSNLFEEDLFEVVMEKALKNID
jgi:hypothetical protein